MSKIYETFYFPEIKKIQKYTGNHGFNTITYKCSS